MRNYTISIAQVSTHQHPAPERTAYRRATSAPMDFDVICKVWPSRGAMLQTLRMQEQSEPRPDHWRAVVKEPRP